MLVDLMKMEEKAVKVSSNNLVPSENIQKTIDSLTESETYDQRKVVWSCGTPACIAGHAIKSCTDYTLLGKHAVYSKSGKLIPGGCVSVMANLFGITYEQSNAVFRAHPDPNKYTVTKQDAIDMLERLLVTGEVYWY